MAQKSKVVSKVKDTKFESNSQLSCYAPVYVKDCF